MGVVSVGMAILAGVFCVIGIPAKEAAGYGTAIVLIVLMACVGALCLVGVSVAVMGMVSKRRSPLLPVVGLVLNPLVGIAFGIYLWWPTGGSLVLAADNGDADGVHWALGMGVEVNAVAELKERDGKGFTGTALVAAARNGQGNAVAALLAAGAQVDAADSMGRTAFYHALTKGHASVAVKLLKHNADPNLSPDARTPIYFAAGLGDTSLVEMMLRQKAQTNPKEFAPLLSAAEAGHTKIVELLLDHKADLNAVDGDGNTAMHIAASKGHQYVVKLLLRRKARFDLLNRYGETALEMAIAGEHKPIIDDLVNVGSPIDVFAAIGLGDLERVQKELDQDPKLVSAVKRDLTPLHIAARRGELEIVSLLIEKGAMVNAGTDTSTGITPLYLATRGGHLEVVKALVANMAEVNHRVIVDGTEAPPLYFAVVSGFEELVETLLSAGAEVNARCTAPPLPGTATPVVGSPLMFAVTHRRLAIAQRLINAKAEIDYRPRPDGPTPLYEAVQNADVDMVTLLISNKADVNARVAGQSLTATIEERQRGHQSAEKYDRIFSMLRDNGALD
jgi:serine/threonine-protein phosphatase 6 regulatory ankyrin repeat subunit B